jgi:hypothetical protein
MAFLGLGAGNDCRFTTNSIRPENQKLIDSYKPRPILELDLKPRTAYSTPPRVQRAFRRLVNWKKYEERQRQLSTKTSKK